MFEMIVVRGDFAGTDGDLHFRVVSDVKGDERTAYVFLTKEAILTAAWSKETRKWVNPHVVTKENPEWAAVLKKASSLGAPTDYRGDELAKAAAQKAAANPPNTAGP